MKIPCSNRLANWLKEKIGEAMKRATAPGYDLFKLIITLVLLTILIFMTVRGCSVAQAPLIVSETTGNKITEAVSPSPISWTMTISPTTPNPIATSTVVPTLTAVPAFSPTPDSPVVTATSIPSLPSSLACATTLPSRLSVGISARLIGNLNMRNAPEVTAQILQTNPAGTKVEIIDGPVCTPKDESSYLWWKIRLNTGSEGWSAETPLNNRSYFLEPIP